LSSNQLSEIKNVEQLTQLRQLKGLNLSNSLRLNNNQIVELKHLASLTQLSSLDLSNNQISELKHLEQLTQLTWLFLNSNQISELKHLASLTELSTLNLRSNQIVELKHLASLTQLSELYLCSNQIVELKHLASLTQLRTLYLRSNQIDELKHLASLTQLTRLDLSNNQISELPDFLLQLNQPILWLTQRENRFEKGIYIKDCNFLKQPPVEFAKLGDDVIRAYFAQKRNKVGRYGKGQGVLEGMTGDMQEIKDNIKNEGRKTRETVTEEHDKIREILKEIPEIFCKDLDESQNEILANVFTQINKLEIDIDGAKDLIEIVGKGIDELYYKVDARVVEKANRAIRKVQRDESLDLKEKLKITVPLIHLFFKYEKELSSESFAEIKESWKKMVLRACFFFIN